jgi:hypothetical protein
MTCRGGLADGGGLSARKKSATAEKTVAHDCSGSTISRANGCCPAQFAPSVPLSNHFGLHLQDADMANVNVTGRREVSFVHQIVTARALNQFLTHRSASR